MKHQWFVHVSHASHLGGMSALIYRYFLMECFAPYSISQGLVHAAKIGMLGSTICFVQVLWGTLFAWKSPDWGCRLVWGHAPAIKGSCTSLNSTGRVTGMAVPSMQPRHRPTLGQVWAKKRFKMLKNSNHDYYLTQIAALQ